MCIDSSLRFLSRVSDIFVQRTRAETDLTTKALASSGQSLNVRRIKVGQEAYVSGQLNIGWPDGDWPVKLPNAEVKVLKTRGGNTSSLSTFIWNYLAPGAEIAIHPPRSSSPGRVFIERTRPTERTPIKKVMADEPDSENSDELLLLAIERALDRLGTPARFELVWALLTDRGIDLPPAAIIDLLCESFDVDDFGTVRTFDDAELMDGSFRPGDCRWDNIEQVYWELHSSEQPPYLERMYRKRRASVYDGLEYYLDDIRHSLLSADEEKMLGSVIEVGQAAQDELRDGEVDLERKKELGLAIRAADEAREEFLLHNLRLVFNNAVKYRRKIRGTALGIPDLVQAGYVGLRNAVEKFDPSKGFKFSTYATWWIRQAITRQIANRGRTIRLPVHMYDRVQTIQRVQDAKLAEQGRPATPSELAIETGLTESEVKSVLDIHEVAGLEGADEISVETTEELGIEELSLEETRQALREALSGFDPRLHQILTQRFGLGGEPPRTLEEIGETMNVTRERIRQLEKKALKLLNTDMALRRIATDWILPEPSSGQGEEIDTSVDHDNAWKRVRERARVIEALNRE